MSFKHLLCRSARRALLLLCGCSLSLAASALEWDSVYQPAIVVLIDDMGDNLARGEAALALPGPVTYAILPHSPYGQRLARGALAGGKEVMLHAPMENTHDRPLGPGALTSDLEKDQFVDVLSRDLDFVPGVVGLNNHMGSLLTTLQTPMGWVMEVAKSRQLFFIDSGTTAETVAWRVAREHGIPYLRRDVFLDHERTTEFVDRQFHQALKIARRQGVAVVIGHPYQVTVDYLRQALPELDQQGIRLVAASAWLHERQHRQQLAADEHRRELERSLCVQGRCPGSTK